jgi:L-lactate dehydrogenase complex protein LldE
LYRGARKRNFPSSRFGVEMPSRGRVALFVTCLVDGLRPRVGFAAAALLEAAGFEVEVPLQSCCGQPNYNGGDAKGAAAIARATMRAFKGYPHVVAPSGSCAAMIRCHYPSLFAEGTRERRAAEELAARTHELTSFLHEFAGRLRAPPRLDATATYHDACSGLRELGVKAQPRALLSQVGGLTLKEMKDPESCCGFGGAFCVKYPAISNRIVEEKIDQIAATGAEFVVTGDVGCLLNIEGKIARGGGKVRAVHVAEVLAGMTEDEK